MEEQKLKIQKQQMQKRSSPVKRRATPQQSMMQHPLAQMLATEAPASASSMRKWKYIALGVVSLTAGILYYANHEPESEDEF